METRSRSVALSILTLGAFLVAAAPWLSLFSLVGVFLIGSGPGVVVGFGKSGWRGAATYALAFGGSLIAALVVVVIVFGNR